MIYKVEDNTGEGTGSVGIVSQRRAPGTWTSQLAWEADEQVGDAQPASLINTIEYVDPDTDERIPWVFTRDKIYARRDGEWRSILLPALRAFASEQTGYAAAVHNTFLYLSLGGGLFEQLSNGSLIDVGPTKGENLPFGRRGEVVSAESYPGKMFLAVDHAQEDGAFGPNQWSSILQFSGHDSIDPLYEGGWGRRIRWTFVQRIPSAQKISSGYEEHGMVSRLWFQEGGDLMWLDLARQGDNPLTDPYYQSAPEGLLYMSRIYANLDDRQKVFSSLKIISESLDGGPGVGSPDGEAWVEVGAIADQVNPSEYPPIVGGFFNQSPSQERFLTDYSADAVVPMRGRFLSLLLSLNIIPSRNGGEPVSIKAALVESLLGLPVKYAFSPLFLARDDELDLNGDPQDAPMATALAFVDQLETHADGLQMFTLHSVSPTLHGKKVIIAAPEIRPKAIASGPASTEEQTAKEAWIGSMNVIQVILN